MTYKRSLANIAVFSVMFTRHIRAELYERYFDDSQIMAAR